jgi:uncharacterized coiled-coil protein SlyX
MSDSGNGVHRLVDMVVEEVSLVDRPANKQRFLIVKRDDVMPDELEDETSEVDAAEDDTETDATVAADAADAVSPPPSPTGLEGIAAELRAAVSALTPAIARLAAPPAPTASTPPTQKQSKGAGGAASPELTALCDTVQKMAEAVRGLTERLVRVEKQHGLPNSTPKTERVPKPDDVGWPLDLNNPMGRESVDKAVSFHDL